MQSKTKFKSGDLVTYTGSREPLYRVIRAFNPENEFVVVEDLVTGIHTTKYQYHLEKVDNGFIKALRSYNKT